jgi:serine/threonine-protein kinase ATR
LCIRFGDNNVELVALCTECLGLVGCIDPNRVEATRENKDIIVPSNFVSQTEVIDFCAHLLETVLVKAFHSAGNARAQGFIAYVMQELMKFCEFKEALVQRNQSTSSAKTYQRWLEIPESTRTTLTPFLNSLYNIKSNIDNSTYVQTYPIFDGRVNHATWLRCFVADLLRKGKGDNASLIFSVLARIVRGHDLSIPTFLLPFAALNVIVAGTEEEAAEVRKELLAVLNYPLYGGLNVLVDDVKYSSEVRKLPSFMPKRYVANTVTECLPSSRLLFSLVAGKTQDTVRC